MAAEDQGIATHEQLAGERSLAQDNIGHRTKWELAQNIGWLVSERVIALCTGVLVNVWFVRHLGPDRYGVYAYALSYGALLAAIAGAGLETIVVREIAKDESRASEILGTALAIRAVAAIASGVLFGVLGCWAEPDPASRVVLSVVLAGVMVQVLGVFDLWYQAKVSARTPAVTRTVVTLLGHGGRVALILASASLVAFGVLYAVTAALSTAAVYATFCLRRDTPRRLRVNWSLVRPLLRDAWPLCVTGVAVTVYIRIDQIMLSRLSGARATGLYATAVTLSELWNILPVAIATTVFPGLVRERVSVGFGKQMQQLYDFMVAGSYVVAVAVSLAAPAIVAVALGPQYGESAAILRIHVWTLVFVALGVARSRYLVAENMTRFPLLATALGCVVNIGLNFVLIPAYAGAGAAWATLAAQVVATYASGFLLARVRPQAVMMTRALAVPVRLRDIREYVRVLRREL